jgi:hypothetical protein
MRAPKSKCATKSKSKSKSKWKTGAICAGTRATAKKRIRI